jgi:hypothetical protein
VKGAASLLPDSIGPSIPKPTTDQGGDRDLSREEHQKFSDRFRNLHIYLEHIKLYSGVLYNHLKEQGNSVMH